MELFHNSNALARGGPFLHRSPWGRNQTPDKGRAAWLGAIIVQCKYLPLAVWQIEQDSAGFQQLSRPMGKSKIKQRTLLCKTDERIFLVVQ